MSTILCIEDEPAAGKTLERALLDMGHRPVVVSSIGAGLRAATREAFDLVISDDELPDGTGSELVMALQRSGRDVPVIVTSPFRSVEAAASAVRLGAVDYLTRPLRAEAVRIAVKNAIELDRMRRLQHGLERELSDLKRSHAQPGIGPPPAGRIEAGTPGAAVDEGSFNLAAIERATILRAMEMANGHRGNAARALGIAERTLRNKLKAMFSTVTSREDGPTRHPWPTRPGSSPGAPTYDPAPDAPPKRSRE